MVNMLSSYFKVTSYSHQQAMIIHLHLFHNFKQVRYCSRSKLRSENGKPNTGNRCITKYMHLKVNISVFEYAQGQTEDQFDSDSFSSDIGLVTLPVCEKC